MFYLCVIKIRTYKMHIAPISYSSPSFSANRVVYSRKTHDNELKQVSCYTQFFRPDIKWDSFSSYLKERYHGVRKVNVINAACSDGSEPYSIVMALKKNLEDDALKFFPIDAFDYNERIIAGAKRGLVNFSLMDYAYFIHQGINHEDYFEPVKNPLYSNSIEYTLYQAKDNLRENVNFRLGEILNVLSKMDDKTPNTVLLCRNMIPYLSFKERNALFDLISKKLGKNSTVVFGAYDYDKTGSFINHKMITSGFKQANLSFGSPVYQN